MAYTNSSLVSYTRLSPNHSGQRTHSIDRITPHCVVGQATAERIAEIFATTDRQASCNYGIGRDGRISLVVEEKNRSWCSSSKENDQRAITIEVASDSTAPYAFRDEAYAALIALCVDICKRNGKKKLLWLADKAKTLAYNPAADEMLLSVHRWFANKSCPGDWMYARMDDLASKVTAALGGENVDASVPVVDTNLKKGSIGDAVKTMQTMLIACGYSCGSTGADGDFGKNTEAAVKTFQIAAGLTVDGIYGPVTKAALEKAYANRMASQPATDNNEKAIWDRLYAAIENPCGVSGVLANFYAESALKSTNLQNSFEKKLGMTDVEYTAAVDNGTYTNFVHDSAGYGLFQATFWSIKESLLNYAKSKGVSIGDRDMQVDWFLQAMKNDYKAIWTVLTTAKTVREASDAVLLKFERPADQSEAVQVKRAGYGQTYFDKYGKATPAPTTPGSEEKPVVLEEKYAKYINSTGTHY
ncbi:MAG: peptidoglycan-binding protein, partial [Clostridia bacterium]|nr:peptidoglycan-binding protein [Clostridia bacterium]